MAKNKIEKAVDQVDEDNIELDEEGTAALATLQPDSMPADRPANLKTSGMAIVMNAMAGMDKETINKFVASLEKYQPDSIPDGAAEQNKATINAKGSPILSSEDMDEIFSGEDLSEDFRTKAGTLFEAAVSLKVSQETARLEEELEEKLEEEVGNITADLEEAMDKYLSYAVSEWTNDNEVAIESTLRNEITESFMNELKGLFESHYINVPETEIDALDALAERVKELEESISEQISENVDLRQENDALKISTTFEEVSEGLTSTQKEKLMGLSENLSFESFDDFEAKLKTIKENYFSESKKDSKDLAESMSHPFEEAEELVEDTAVKTGDLPQGQMANYVDAISRTLGN